MADTLSVGSSDQDDRMQYVKTELFHSSTSVGTGSGDDNSFFVSEPSASVATSEANSTETVMRLGAAGVEDISDSLLFFDRSADDEEDNTVFYDDSLPPTIPVTLPAKKSFTVPSARNGHTNSQSYSPDSFSLSSYDTSSPNRWSGIHNLEEDTGEKIDSERNNNRGECIAQPNIPRTATQRLIISNKPIATKNSQSNSISEASEGEVVLLEEFLHDLRIDSEGQVKESSVPGSNASFESSILLHGSTDVEDVLRRCVTSKSAPRQRPKKTQTSKYCDSFATMRTDSIIMTLSDDTGDNQMLLGDRIESSLLDDGKVHMLSSTASLPPLHSCNTTGVENQQREYQSGQIDGKNQPTNQNKIADIPCFNNESNNNRNNLKSTIDYSGDEWSHQEAQEREIGLFSKFAIGSGSADGATPRRRRTKQRSYRQMRRKSNNQSNSCGDSLSLASSEHSYTKFFQSPTPSLSYPISDISNDSTKPSLDVLPNNSGHTESSTIKRSGNTRLFVRTNSLNLNHSKSDETPPRTSLSYDGVRNDYSGLQSTPINTESLPQHIPPHQHQRICSDLTALGGNLTRSRLSSFDRQFAFDQYSQQYAQHQQHIERPHDSRLIHPQHFPPNIPQFQPSIGGTEQRHFNQQEFQEGSYANEDYQSISEHSSDDSLENKRNIHQLQKHPDHNVIQHRQQGNSYCTPSNTHAPQNPQKFDRRQFLPQTYSIPETTKYPTYICPTCKTRQREFFTVSSAPKQESAGSYIALFFAMYVIGSLYVFGLQEGWGKLDCIYFAVITLTTAGLGDYVPTTDGSKIVCSIFIYFGVACIGLLLGSYIASMLDERSYEEAVANQIKACPNCARIQNMKEAAQRRMNDGLGSKGSMVQVAEMHATSLRKMAETERASKKIRPSNEVPFLHGSERFSVHQTWDNKDDVSSISKPPPPPPLPSTPIAHGKVLTSPTTQNQLLGSPMTFQILGRQKHTRHISMDLRHSIGSTATSITRLSPRTDLNIGYTRGKIPATVNEKKNSEHDTPSSNFNMNNKDAVYSSTSPPAPPPPPLPNVDLRATDMCNDNSSEENSECSDESFSSDNDGTEGRKIGAMNARYVIWTLREALVNSLVIIAFGCFGFYLIEGFTLIDSWYFTTVLLTSTGYGDIVPKSDGGKLFATVYLLVAGTLLLHNMSMISMIPLELRKRRTERAVLCQFGDSLDDDALRELATGPLIHRINLDRKDSRGLNECNREMFALAMLIRLGKVTEDDIKQTFAAFRKLDVNHEGVLNSKSIIGGLIQKQRRTTFLNRHEKIDERQQQRQTNVSQGFNTGSSIYPPSLPHYIDVQSSRKNPFTRMSSLTTDQTPLLSMSESSPTHYNRSPFEPSLNE